MDITLWTLRLLWLLFFVGLLFVLFLLHFFDIIFPDYENMPDSVFKEENG